MHEVKMSEYLFNARDVAAYFKWAGIPSHEEMKYLSFLFDNRSLILARPLTIDEQSFFHAVYREMYHLWSVGYIDEFSDYTLIATPGSLPIFCGTGFIALESYMKIIALHLICSSHLPYVRVNFVGLPLLLGISADYHDFEISLEASFRALRLAAYDIFNKDYDISKGIPNEVLCISLDAALKKELFGSNGVRQMHRDDTREKLEALKKSSMNDKLAREKSERKKKTAQAKKASPKRPRAGSSQNKPIIMNED